MSKTDTQKPILFYVNEAFLTRIDKACEDSGRGRSQLIRDAVCCELERMGYKIPRSITGAPSRRGKGGPKKKPAPLAPDTGK